MKTTQRIQILYVIMLSLNCLNIQEGAITAKRYLFINAAESILNRYFENTLTSKDMFFWRRGFAFVFTENEKLWVHSELRKTRFDQGRPHERSPVETDGPAV